MTWLTPWRKGRSTAHPLASLQEEVNRLFDGVWRGDYDLSNVLRRTWAPVLDVTETDENVIVKAEVPGIDVKDLDISITGGVLTIKGEKHEEQEEKDKQFHRVERSYGAFTRAVDLPETVDPEKVKAECQDGVLTITLAKKPEAKARQVQIEVK